MQSNVFAVPEAQRTENGDTPRRTIQRQDSHNRLFGDEDRPSTPHMMGNQPIGATKVNGRSNGQKSSSSSQSTMPRSPRFAQRNPVTGHGIEDYADKPRKPSSRGGCIESGNPVTGEGYKSGDAAEINTNRIPPGGFSSGLW
ncbi:microtubule-associated protein Jupiter-like [Toxorhynchites rutilus septentrionalis]|uniref:microtubule-associated protein Jupiter-like n=1 Tax=Toxorhynchites rutilus septentrionalis TaxID=329112 RepID=UPI00247A6CAC|nr:microtubule-associated protein Jupiter-like [Toxorhynchites rutilus septentrionalis]